MARASPIHIVKQRRHAPPPPRVRGEVKKLSRSRDAVCIRVILQAARKALPRTDGRRFVCSPKEGGGAPNGASSPVAAPGEQQGPSLTAIRYADRSPFGAPTRSCAGIIHPNSAWAALPGITGCKREDPLRHQCSRHPAVRSRAGRDDAQTACKPERRTPLAGTAPAPSVGVTG